jgi:hypothetical protein
MNNERKCFYIFTEKQIIQNLVSILKFSHIHKTKYSIILIVFTICKSFHLSSFFTSDNVTCLFTVYFELDGALLYMFLMEPNNIEL